MYLTTHFQLSEFTRSFTATLYDIDNSLDASVPAHSLVINNLRRLCEQILEPLRAAMGVPIHINSGYRCRRLNKTIGGADNSNHLTGCAADLHIPDYATGHKWLQWIVDNCAFDECLLETANYARSHWLHVALRPTENRFRIAFRNIH